MSSKMLSNYSTSFLPKISPTRISTTSFRKLSGHSNISGKHSRTNSTLDGGSPNERFAAKNLMQKPAPVQTTFQPLG